MTGQLVKLVPPAARACRVAMVAMPFYSAQRPSIQLGLLTAICRRHGFESDAHHLNVALAAELTPELYEPLCGMRGHMTGEWLFGIAAFGEGATTSEEEYLAAFPDEARRLCKEGVDLAKLKELRRVVLPRYLDACAADTDWGRYGVVGFTSSFQQNVASIALARRIKQRYPGVLTVFGGANMEDEMGPELLRAFPEIDYVVVGEGDEVFPALLKTIAAGQDPRGMRGVAARNGDGVVYTGQAPPTHDLDALPVPDYDDYFERLENSSLHGHNQYAWAIPFESSRGCWWGEKHHCTFCGLNGEGMKFRAKAPARLLEELSTLAGRHRLTFFEATDNIADHRWVAGLFDGIAKSRSDYEFFYEIKSNVTQDQIRALHRGGVRWVQPGIESLSTHVLALMRKGCTMLQNLLALKWCRYYRIRVSWNLIWGFPGEEEVDYRRELEVLRLISHLEPPGGCGRIWLERFAPYFTQTDVFPIRSIRPERSYAHAYPPHVNLDRIAYFFDYDMDSTVPEPVHDDTRAWVDEWRARWKSESPDSLVYRRTRDHVFIDDRRGPDFAGSHSFSGPLATAYEYASDQIRSAGQIAAHVNAAHGLTLTRAEIEEAMGLFCSRGLAVVENGRYLALALPANPNW